MILIYSLKPDFMTCIVLFLIFVTILAVLSVTIYVSEFGKERLKEEEVAGPRLPKLKKSVQNNKEMDKLVYCKFTTSLLFKLTHILLDIAISNKNLLYSDTHGKH